MTDESCQRSTPQLIPGLLVTMPGFGSTLPHAHWCGIVLGLKCYENAITIITLIV